jgi:cytochrome o ubiquinol oxidase subunit 2
MGHIPKKAKVLLIIGLLAALAAIAAGYSLVKDTVIAVLDPKGTIAAQERELIITATLLMLIIVLPVFVMTFFIAWKYRASNEKARYSPDWDHNRAVEFTWWAIPTVIIAVLSVIAWESSHRLDPFKPLASDVQPINVQVVALQWRWLFIYPDYEVASINHFEMPVGVPVNFRLTSDAPMNSFWIPQLGGQIYAMSGMSTKLHLQADAPGTYDGASANISGEGFASMKFTASAVTAQDFFGWIREAKQSGGRLDTGTYERLAEPSKNRAIAMFSNVDSGLYDRVITKFTRPGGYSASGQSPHEHGEGGHEHY